MMNLNPFLQHSHTSSFASQLLRLLVLWGCVHFHNDHDNDKNSSCETSMLRHEEAKLVMVIEVGVLGSCVEPAKTC